MCACFQTKLTKMISCRWSGGLSVNKEYCAGNHNSRGHKKYNLSLKSNLCTAQAINPFVLQQNYKHWVTRPKNFIETDTETFFLDQNFRDRDFFSRPNIFETDTETFFWDQMFSRLIPRLFFETKCFRDWYRDFFETKFFRDWYRDFCKS